MDRPPDLMQIRRLVMNALRLHSFTVPLVLFVFAGCNTQPDAPKEKTYDVKGKVMAVQTDPKDLKVKLDHEAIPGLMEPMKMWFKVQDAKVLEGIKEGDGVHGRFKLVDGNYIIIELMKH
jgi:Cu/Ag efflux protein CusF